MKKYVALQALLFLPLIIFGKTDYSSQIYMFTRPVYHTIALRNGVWEKIITPQESHYGSTIQIVPLYQKTTHYQSCAPNASKKQKSPCDCSGRGYFLIHCKPEIIVKSGDMQSDVLDRDVRAEWLEITTPNFEGKLTLCPERKEYGAIIFMNQGLGALVDWDFLKNWWVELSIPVIKVKSRLNTLNSSPEVTDALKRNNLHYTRIVNTQYETKGIAEIRVTAGSTYLDKNGFFLAYYTGLGLPGERKPHPEILFEPTRGNNGHFNVIAGINAKIPIMDYDENCSIQAFLNIENKYYLHNHQWRTFDLKGCDFLHGQRPWSRYLLVRREGETATIPAANILTFEVKVLPHSFFELSAGLQCDNEQFHCEIGYDLWAHQSEQIEFHHRRCHKTRYKFQQYGIAGTGTNSASKSSIQKRAPDDKDENNNDIFVTIKDTDINLESGAGAAGSSHRLHVTCYYKGSCDVNNAVFSNKNVYAGLGFFYEFPRTNTTLQTWGLWSTIGTNF